MEPAWDLYSIRGFMNLTRQQNTPMFICLPHFLHSLDDWRTGKREERERDRRTQSQSHIHTHAERGRDSTPLSPTPLSLHPFLISPLFSFVLFFPGKLVGMSDADIEKHETILSVEPTTGATMRARKRLQFNIYIPPANEVMRGRMSERMEK